MTNRIFLIISFFFSLSIFTNAQSVVKGEYFFDNKVNYGSGTPLPIDNNSGNVTVNTSIDISNLSEGVHRLFYRFQDSNGRWSTTLNYPLFVKRNEAIQIIAGEYFFNESVPFGAGFPIDINNAATAVSIDEMVTIPPSLPLGEHQMFYRFQDSNGKWSQTLSTFICVDDEVSITNTTLEGNIKVYPNPTVSMLQINLKNPDLDIRSIVLTNGLGEILLIKQLSNSSTELIEIDLSTFTAGLYLITLVNSESERLHSERIVKL